MKKKSVLLTPALALALLLLSPVTSLSAATFNVNYLSDSIDISPGDGICDDGQLSGTGSSPVPRCSLRAAIMESNALAGFDRITLPAGEYVLSIPRANFFEGAQDDYDGDLDIFDDLLIQGAGADQTIVNAVQLNRVFSVGRRVTSLLPPAHVAAIVEMYDITITGGKTPNGHTGGGISAHGPVLRLYNCIVSGNESGGDGGGISQTGLYEDSNLLLYNTTVTKNSTGSGRSGGGIAATGPMTIRQSTIFENSGWLNVNRAAGIYINLWHDVLIENSTISSNSPGGLGVKGGVTGDDTVDTTVRELVLTNVTIANNYDAGLTLTQKSPDVTGIRKVILKNTLIGDNIQGVSTATSDFKDCRIDLSDLSRLIELESLGNNLIENAKGCFNAGAGSVTPGPNDQLGLVTIPMMVDPLLSPLTSPLFGLIEAGYEHHRPQIGSPALDRGNNTFCSGVTDQIGNTRIQGGQCDIGAVEMLVIEPRKGDPKPRIDDSYPGPLRQRESRTQTGPFGDHRLDNGQLFDPTN